MNSVLNFDGREQFDTYLLSLERDDPEWLESLRGRATEDDIPIIRRQSCSLLKVLLALTRPERILEVGTAVGYSALFMAAHDPDLKELVTMENYPPRIEQAKKNFMDSRFSDHIRLLAGDAKKLLKDLDGEFDFVFLDAAKAQYITILPDILRLTKKGGLIVADNVLKEGDILKPHQAIEKRDRTIHKRMREFLYGITHTDELETAILSAGDGTAVSVRL